MKLYTNAPAVAGRAGRRAARGTLSNQGVSNKGFQGSTFIVNASKQISANLSHVRIDGRRVDKSFTASDKIERLSQYVLHFAPFLSLLGLLFSRARKKLTLNAGPKRRLVLADLCANKRPISRWCFEQVADWLIVSHGY